MTARWIDTGSGPGWAPDDPRPEPPEVPADWWPTRDGGGGGGGGETGDESPEVAP